MELRELWRSDTAQVLISEWDRARHPADREGSAKTAVIEFIRTGSYSRRARRGDFLVDPNHVAFFNPAESFRVSHPCGDHNTGLSVRLSPGLVAGVLAERGPAAFVAGDRPFLAAHALTSPRCHLLQKLLVSVLSRQSPDPTLVEEVLLSLVREAATAPYHGGDIARGGGQRRKEPGREDRVETVRRYLLLHWAERLTLTRLARLVGCSSWHLASIFRVRVGLPIHRYLKRLRLRHALERLREGYTDLTRLALECGFSSHSHFSAAFRQEFGTVPGAIRSMKSTPFQVRHAVLAASPRPDVSG